MVFGGLGGGRDSLRSRQAIQWFKARLTALELLHAVNQAWISI